MASESKSGSLFPPWTPLPPEAIRHRGAESPGRRAVGGSRPKLSSRSSRLIPAPGPPCVSWPCFPPPGRFSLAVGAFFLEENDNSLSKPGYEARAELLASEVFGVFSRSRQLPAGTPLLVPRGPSWVQGTRRPLLERLAHTPFRGSPSSRAEDSSSLDLRTPRVPHVLCIQ